MLRATPPLRAFVREQLGCTCPEDVFDTVERGGLDLDGRPAGTRLVVGGRLLIYVATGPVDAPSVAALAGAGRRDRDGHGLNRFRLAIAAPPDAASRGALEAAFTGAVAGDPKAHLHCLAGAAIALV